MSDYLKAFEAGREQGRLEGIRAGLEAAAKAVCPKCKIGETPDGTMHNIIFTDNVPGVCYCFGVPVRALSPEDILKEMEKGG